jgi:tryptophan halogenase
MSDDGRIRSIAVAGGGIVGLSAALAFARALPEARVAVIDLPRDPAALADRMPGTLPSIHLFHRLIGVDEGELVRNAQATHRIGLRFENWSADGSPWLHGFGHHGTQMHSSPFPHQWLRARKAGRALPYHLYAPVAAMGEAGKFVHPVQDQRSLLASFQYALRLDPEPYRALLLRHAENARVNVRAGNLGCVEPDGAGGAAALLLADGTRVEADLFVDCAGPSAPILSALDARFEDWGGFLPCDRVLLGERPEPHPGPVDTAWAVPSGWHWKAPLRSRTLVGAAFSSALSGEDEARETLGADDAESLSIACGRRPDAWVRNVVAFGDSAVSVDPLESTNLHLAQNAIARAVSLIPGRDFQPLLLREYNRRTRAETDRVRDFIALHYAGSPRRDGAFWKSMESRAKPESLAHTLEQFEGRGRLPKFEEETFSDDSWFAVLFGLGVEPRRIDPTVYRVPFEESVATMERVAQMSAALPADLPPYREYLARLG